MIDLRWIKRGEVKILQFRGMTLGKWGSWKDVREEIEDLAQVAFPYEAPVTDAVPKKKKKK